MNFSTTSSEAPPGAPRRYACILIAAAMAMFLATMAANVILDPEGMFGTGLYKPILRNHRYFGFVDYRRTAPRIEGLIFGSSRALAFDVERMRQYAKLDGDLLNLAVPFGEMTDHLPMLEYILRDKAARGETIKAVVLFVDLDLFGLPPLTNRNVDAFLAPQVTGETPARL